MTIACRCIQDMSILAIQAPTIDAITAAAMKDELLEALKPLRKVVIDLSAVRGMDSSGIGVILAGLRSLMDRQGTLKLVCPPGPVLQLIRLVKMEKLVRVFPSTQEAIDDFPAG